MEELLAVRVTLQHFSHVLSRNIVQIDSDVVDNLGKVRSNDGCRRNHSSSFLTKV